MPLFPRVLTPLRFRLPLGRSVSTLTFQPQPALDGGFTHAINSSTAFAPQPAIIVLQEWWGINDQIKDHAQRLANETGATAIIPDLYNGKSTLDAEEASHLMSNLDWTKALGELEELVVDLRKGENAERKIGAVGFCMGGALSLALASKLSKSPHPLNAVSSFYGTPSAEHFDIGSIPIVTPCQAHFGEKDEFAGFSDVETAKKLEKAWTEAIKTHGGFHAKGLHKLEANVYIYPGQGHAFMNNLSWAIAKRSELGFVGGFDPDLVNTAWRRTFHFFIEHLKTL
ncbi:dienelactone hydrolase [Polychytrium aggregatum]|uniref:dienelactone hydrolase n=1 Tax=Polychytrium aggregatum TaxID=110093 RepID=UPI0022FE2494|nr:dienelactone hydrolase [Polychytrium aggregatum]KAI9205754.1 dienelactone hydrolase [Polychytrium aggregatum]